MSLLFKGLRAWSRGREAKGDLRLSRGRVVARTNRLAPRRRDRLVAGDGYLALPGLINGHDHLSLNLLPRLGAPPYRGFYEWAEAIYRPDEPPIREVQRLPAIDRLWWGGYKNLIAGATTVVHHDPYARSVFRRRFPVRVLRRYGWAHSLGFGGDVATTHRRARGRPFIIHAAEGLDERAQSEIDELDHLSALTSNTVLIHAMALDDDQQSRLAASGAGVVWCPVSNLWLYGQTAPVGELLGRVLLALGSDSTLSGPPTLLHEIAGAAATGLASAEQILAMVTTSAADLFQLTDGRGTLEPGAPGDLLLLPDRGASAADALIAARIRDVALVTVAGEPRLASPELAEALGLGAPNARIDGAPKWLYGDLAALKGRLAANVDEKILLSNPLWSILEPTR